MKAAIYCRVSTKEQTQNLSLTTQLKACMEFGIRKGFDIAKVFEDAGESAKTTERPEFQALLSYCRQNKGRLDAVIVYNVSRFSRNTQDHAIVRGLLRTLGVSLLSATEPIGDDSIGMLTENMLAAFAQFDNNVRAERTKAGMRTALERGQWTWVAPLGYRNGNKRAGEASLVPDPTRSGLVQQAFELVSTGEHSVADVLRRVTVLGLRTLRDEPLTPQSFGGLLRKRIYSGSFQVPGFGLGTIRGDFAPLVTETLFDRVQAVLRRSDGPSTHQLNNPDYPLRRFVKCGACEKPLTGSAPRGRSRSYAYYHCRSCSGVRIRKEELETQFLALLETLKPDPAFMPLFKAIVLDVWKTKLIEAERVKTLLETRLEGLRRRATALDEAYLYDRKIDAQTYEAQRDKLREEIALARMELEDVKLNALDVEGLLGFAEHILTNAARLWIEASPAHRSRLQSVLFPEGLRFSDGRFGTATTCLAFKQLAGNSSESEGVVTPEGFEPSIFALKGRRANRCTTGSLP
jgi:site-specific DNA recombinase